VILRYFDIAGAIGRTCWSIQPTARHPMKVAIEIALGLRIEVEGFDVELSNYAGWSLRHRYAAAGK
jgi:hypothetical protein